MVINSASDTDNVLMLSGEDLELAQDGATTPSSKRLKAFEGSDGECFRDISGEEMPEITPKHYQSEVPDSDAENYVEETGRTILQAPTELETASAPIMTDQGAIEAYEAMRMIDEGLPENLKARLSQMSWARGKSSIYVDAFNLALETVLDEELHLFDERELEIFEQWRRLEYEAQYLYVRLFLRKTAAWHRVNRLTYYSDIADIPATISILQKARELPESAASLPQNPAELSPPDEMIPSTEFRFADSSNAQITTLEEASSLLSLDELKVVAKDAKVQGKSKSELLNALRRMSRRQSGLYWSGLKRSGNGEPKSVQSPAKELDPSEGHGFTEANRDGHFLRKIMAIIGPCVRLSLPTLKLFERVHLVFYRSTEWTEKSLTTIILARISRRNFPEYIVSRSTNIFPSRHDLLEFEAALRTQFRVDNLLELNGSAGLQEVLDIFDQVYPRWETLLREEQRKEDRVYESGEGAYLRRFSPAWVYTRIVHKGAYVLGRLKKYEREHEVTTALLDQKLFHDARRGAWYQRKALLEENYMFSVRPYPGISGLERQKRFWRRKALQTCERGIQDNDCHLIYHYGLQKRIKKLERQLKVPKREQHDFGHVLLADPTEITVEGIQIKKEYPPTGRRSGPNAMEECQRSTKTIWMDELGSGEECSVEEMCLSWYRSQGMKGYHSEGGIIRTLFAYLFYDIMFTYVPNVFQTAYQTCPLDLHTDAFFPSRISEINRRLVEIANGDAAGLIRIVNDREREKRTCVIGLNWDFDIEDLLEIVNCFDGSALATICKVLAQGYGARGGGMPDLFLWDPVKKTVMFSEVKSENDRLSDTQRLWIHVLTGAGIRVDLCNAVAREMKAIQA